MTVTFNPPPLVCRWWQMVLPFLFGERINVRSDGWIMQSYYYRGRFYVRTFTRDDP